MFLEELKRRILILDGAMGTMLQSYFPIETSSMCYELLNETQEELVKKIHENYILAGADILETNSFSANELSLQKYGLENKAFSFAKKSVEIAKKATKITKRKIYIAGSIGPSSISLTSLLGRNKSEIESTFSNFKKSYKEQIKGLICGGVDILFVETIFDLWNAKAILASIEEVRKEMKQETPVCLSMTVDLEGKLFTGESIEESVEILDRDFIIGFGLNCSFAMQDLFPLLKRLQEATTKYILFYPNAGLPRKDGSYDKNYIQMLPILSEHIQKRKINIVGGCCGINHEDIRKLAMMIKKK